MIFPDIREAITRFTSFINSQSPSLSFTFEYSNEKVSFLDLLTKKMKQEATSFLPPYMRSPPTSTSIQIRQRIHLMHGITHG